MYARANDFSYSVVFLLDYLTLFSNYITLLDFISLK